MYPHVLPACSLKVLWGVYLPPFLKRVRINSIFVFLCTCSDYKYLFSSGVQYFCTSPKVRKDKSQSLILYIYKKKTPWSECASELYRPSNRRLLVKWLPTFADKLILYHKTLIFFYFDQFTCLFLQLLFTTGTSITLGNSQCFYLLALNLNIWPSIYLNVLMRQLLSTLTLECHINCLTTECDVSVLQKLPTEK
jgi:hypothetical protein